MRSAVQQTYSNLEIIVVDDGSSDNTRTIAENFAIEDRRISIFSVPNGGVAKARNLGIEKASGEFVAFLDADDLWHPTKIERQVAHLSATGLGKGAVAVYTLSRVIDADDRVLGSGSQILFSGYTFARHLCFKPIGNCSSMLVRREAALAVGGFDSKYASSGIGGCEDLDFELKITSEYLVSALRSYLVGYRSYYGNMSSNKVRMARGVLATIKHHIRSHPELPEFAVRNANGSTLEYALKNFLVAHRWRLAAPVFTLLLRTDFRRSLELAAKLFKRRLVAWKTVILLRTPNSKDLPSFYDLNPDSGSDPLGQSRWSRDLLHQLETVDNVLAMKIGLKL